jgi:hypothetical protein
LTQEPPLTVYVDAKMLRFIGESMQEPTPVSIEGDAAKRLWQRFIQGEVRLVTVLDDTEIDIILWMNREGCCVFDTLMLMEAIDHFAGWGRSETGTVELFRRVVDLFEQLEGLPPNLREVPEDSVEAERDLRKALSEGFSLWGDCGSGSGGPVETREMLLFECLAKLKDWYRDSVWHDMRSIEYERNWEILAEVLEERGTYALFQGNDAGPNRELFGLLCRAVNLSKKSCPSPEMSRSHVEFVIKTVLEKYGAPEGERTAAHYIHCIRQGVAWFLTPDPGLAGFVNAKVQTLKGQGRLSCPRLEVVSPSQFESRMKGT